MRFREAMNLVSDAHRLLSSAPLVIEFSSPVALNVFLRTLEQDIGMPSGELRATQLREGGPHQMYDGIEFRVKPRDMAKEAAKQFWQGYENLADVA